MPDFVIGRDVFSQTIAQRLGCEYRSFRHLYRPDGEPAPKIEAGYKEIEGRHVVLVLQGAQRPERDRVTRNMHNFARHIGNLYRHFRAGRIDVVEPYYWLARQDKDPRTDKSAKVRENDKGRDDGHLFMAIDYKVHGADRLITFNPHFYRREGEGMVNVGGLDIYYLSGIPPLARYAKKLVEKGSLSPSAYVLGPDLNSGPLVKEFVRCSSPYFRSADVLKKDRIGESEVRHRTTFNANGEDALFFDDILSTLTTLRSGVRSIENAGNIDCFAVHGVLPPEGHDRSADMKQTGEVRRFVTTDTIDNDYGREPEASVIPCIVEFYEKNKDPQLSLF